VKRNLLLLTAVVLAVVLLSGCTLLPWTWGKVKIETEVPKGVIVKKDLTQYVKKNSPEFELVLRLEKDKDVEGYTWTIARDSEEAEVINPTVEEGKVTFAFPVAEEKVIKITGTAPEADK
jgi:hypothetical protein